MKKHTLAFGLMAALGFSTTALAAGAAQSIHVYKSPTCGCCDDWIDHLKENGFEVEEGISGIPTAWMARWGSGSPVIALGSDIDGIPKHTAELISAGSSGKSSVA